MKAALVFFYSDSTLLVRKQSQCCLRTSFEQGHEVEVKCGGCPYVALILRTADSTQSLDLALKEGLQILDNFSKEQKGPEWQSKVVKTLLTSLPTCNAEVSPEEQSSKGRKRKVVDYTNRDDSLSDHDQAVDANQSTNTTTEQKTKKTKATKGTNSIKATKTADKESTKMTNGKSTKEKTIKKKNVKPAVQIPDTSINDQEAAQIEAMDLTKDVPLLTTWTANTSSSCSSRTDKQVFRKSRKTFSGRSIEDKMDLTKDVPPLTTCTANTSSSCSSRTDKQESQSIKKTNSSSDNSKVGSGNGRRGSDAACAAAKEPKASLPCPRSRCKETRKELAELREKYGELEAKYRKTVKELQEESRKLPAGNVNGPGDAVLKPGKLSQEVAAEKKMIELIGGSGVYLFKSQLLMCKSSCKSRSSLACQLLRVFFSDEELKNGKLSERANGDHLSLLDPHIVNVIKAYCSSTAFKPEQEVKEGHKKGIAHAMTLSIKQLQRRALKKENKNTMAAGTSTSELQQQNVHASASDNESQGTSHGDSDEDDNIFL